MLNGIDPISPANPQFGASPRAAKSGEVFSVSLDSELLNLLMDTIQKAGLDVNRVHVEDNSRQIFATVPTLGANSAEVAPTPSESPFQPRFQEATVTSSLGGSWALNSAYFAAPETAAWIANRYGTGELVEVPFGGEGGPFAADAKELHIKLHNGQTINAGLLADYFRRNPENQFPGVADRYVRSIVAAAEGQG